MAELAEFECVAWVGTQPFLRLHGHRWDLGSLSCLDASAEVVANCDPLQIGDSIQFHMLALAKMRLRCQYHHMMNLVGLERQSLLLWELVLDADFKQAYIFDVVDVQQLQQACGICGFHGRYRGQACVLEQGQSERMLSNMDHVPAWANNVLPVAVRLPTAHAWLVAQGTCKSFFVPVTSKRSRLLDVLGVRHRVGDATPTCAIAAHVELTEQSSLDAANLLCDYWHALGRDCSSDYIASVEKAVVQLKAHSTSLSPVVYQRQGKVFFSTKQNINVEGSCVASSRGTAYNSIHLLSVLCCSDLIRSDRKLQKVTRHASSTCG